MDAGCIAAGAAARGCGDWLPIGAPTAAGAELVGGLAPPENSSVKPRVPAPELAAFCAGKVKASFRYASVLAAIFFRAAATASASAESAGGAVRCASLPPCCRRATKAAVAATFAAGSSAESACGEHSRPSHRRAPREHLLQGYGGPYVLFACSVSQKRWTELTISMTTCGYHNRKHAERTGRARLLPRGGEGDRRRDAGTTLSAMRRCSWERGQRSGDRRLQGQDRV